MEGHAKEMLWSDIASWRTRQPSKLYKVTTPCLDGPSVWIRRIGISWRIVKSMSRFVLKCSCLARIGRPDILWSVNKFARVVTKLTRTCDKRLAHLISYIHHTSELKQYCQVRNTAQQSRLGLFQDSDFARS